MILSTRIFLSNYFTIGNSDRILSKAVTLLTVSRKMFGAYFHELAFIV